MEKPAIERALAGVRDLYTGSLAEHGPASKSVGWKDEASQLLRFGKLAELIEAGDEPVAVNDWGCGYAAMFGYLDRLLGPRLARYTGYDISAEMIDAARKAVADPRASFVLGAELAEADHTFVSGTFNVKLDAAEEEWGRWVRERLVELARVSRRGLAFNLLSTYVDWKEDHLYYGDPLVFFDFCKRELAPRVSLLHDYPLYEWTILVRFDDGP